MITALTYESTNDNNRCPRIKTKIIDRSIKIIAKGFQMIDQLTITSEAVTISLK